MVGSIAIDRVAHNALFLKTESLIKMAGTVIGDEDIQKEPVCPMFTKRTVCHLGQQLSARALIGNANDQTLEF
jgi:hypothetical protein